MENKKLPAEADSPMVFQLLTGSAALILAAQIGGVEGQHNAGRNHHKTVLLSMNRIYFDNRSRSVYSSARFR